MGVLDPEVAGQILLDAVLASFTAAGHSPPEERFLAAATVPDGECEFLAVRFLRILNGVPGNTKQGADTCGGLRVVEFAVTISRCSNGVTEAEGGGLVIGDPDVYDDEARTAMRDAWCCHVGLAARIHAGQTALDPDDVAITPTTASGPFGDRLRSETFVQIQLGSQGEGS